MTLLNTVMAVAIAIHLGHDSDSDCRTEINAPPVHIGPPKSKSKQKTTESSDVTTFVSDQGI